MAKKDKFGLFKKAHDLIEKGLQYEGGRVSPFCHVASDIPPVCGDCNNPGTELTARYQEVEKEMIAFVADAAKPIKITQELVKLFRDSCFAFGALGFRLDALWKKVVGIADRREDAKLSYAIRRDVNLNPCKLDDENFVMDVFDSLPGEIFTSFDTFDSIDELISAAYNGGHNFAADAAALMAVYLLNHLRKVNAKATFEHLTRVFAGTRCTDYVTSNAWRERSLIGYVDNEITNGLFLEYVNDLNPSFVRIFTDKLDILLAGSGDFATAELKNILFQVAVRCYFGYDGGVLQTFQAVSEFLDMQMSGKTIKAEHVDGGEYRTYVNCSVLIPQHDIASGTTYTLNKTGLFQFCDLIDALSLSDMQGFSDISASIRKL